MPSHYTKITLAERPTGSIDGQTFKTETVPFDFKDKVGSNEVLVKVTYVALEPAMRGWLNDSRSYVPPVKIGEVMRSAGLGVILEAGSSSKFKVGQHVTCYSGWTEFIVLPDERVTALDVPPGAEPLDFLNTLGSSGMTAYFGLKEVCDIKKGETLVVSGAAGSVGVLVCQLALKMGAKVYAIAGSPDKCDWLEKEIGVEKAFNYKSPTFKKDFREIGYVHAFFDNVGGEILDLVLTRLQKGARIALCGAISAYNTRSPAGLHNYTTLIAQRAKMQGFIVFDYESQYHVARAEIAAGLADGSIKRKFHVVEGLKNAPTALPMLFTGGNTGKLVIKVSEDETAKL